MQLKLTSFSSAAQSFIIVAACVAAPSVALADTGGVLTCCDRAGPSGLFDPAEGLAG